MKSRLILIMIILLAVSGCQGMKRNYNYALVVSPVYLPVSPEEGRKFYDPIYDDISLYDLLKRKNFKVEIVSKDPLIYEIPDQKGLLEEFAKMLTTIKTMINVYNMNLTNMNTTKTEIDQPYRRKTLAINKNFEIVEMVDVPGDFKRIYDPQHPDADSDGYVFYPNVNKVEEKVQILNMQSLENAIISIIEKINQNSVVARSPDTFKLYFTE